MHYQNEDMIQNKILFLPTSKGIERIAVDNIVRVEALSNYSKLFFTDGKTLVVAKLLHWFEDNLVTGRFARVHRSHLININYIQKYNTKGDQLILLKDNSFVEVSRRKRAALKKLLQNTLAA